MPQYRWFFQEYTINEERLLAQDLTKEEIPTDFRAFRLMAPILVKFFGSIFAYSACLVLLESYFMGHTLGLGATILFSAIINFYHYKDFIKTNFSPSASEAKKINDETYWHILNKQEQTANYFGPEFFNKT